MLIAHENNHDIPYRAWTGAHFRKKGWGTPSIEDAQNMVTPEVNHGRWIIECPGGCGGAVIASWEFLYYICVECGSPDNDGEWYRVAWPPEWARVEALLASRPAKDLRRATTRNWKPGEAMASLEAENRAHGVEVPPEPKPEVGHGLDRP